MKKLAIIIGLNSLFMTTFGQTKIQNKDASNWIPYLTQKNNFIYVDKSLKKQIDASFVGAKKFTTTDYALVKNDKNEYAVIDAQGKLVLDYSPSEIEMELVNNLTFVLREQEYDKKMPIWNWDANIMGGDIKKTKNYKKFKISVLETNQVLLDKDVKYGEEDYDLYVHEVDDHHIVLNDVLFEIKNNKFIKKRSDIASTLDKGRYIPKSEKIFDIYSVKFSKPILSALSGTDVIKTTINNQIFVLDSLNHDRYVPEVPKLLYNAQDNKTYVYPEYDKYFPREIKNASPDQIEFIKKVSFVYSVNNSPYFILGKFNYDHDIWAYDWLYLDDAGNLLTEINVKDFFIQDQIGRLIWPDKSILLSKIKPELVNNIENVKYIFGSKDLYKIKLKNSNYGIWNAELNDWILQPEYRTIDILNSKLGIYALQKNDKDLYILYNTEKKQQIGTESYDAIYRDGSVQKTLENNEKIYYFIDLETGKEYKE